MHAGRADIHPAVEACDCNDYLYRRRIYRQYVSATPSILAPTTIDGLWPRAADVRKLIREYFPAGRGASILDLGCGRGELIHFARVSGYSNVEGVDCSPEQIASAERLGITGIRQGDLFATLRS